MLSIYIILSLLSISSNVHSPFSKRDGKKRLVLKCQVRFFEESELVKFFLFLFFSCFNIYIFATSFVPCVLLLLGCDIIGII